MRNNNSNAIFLTNESTKQDWMQKDKRPIISYVERVYSLTECVMFIIHAQEPLKVSFENIHTPAAVSKAMDRFVGIHPSYDYYVSSSEPLDVKISVLRDFIMRYKEKAEFSYSTGEGAFSSIVVTALIDGSEDGYGNGPKLYIQPNNSFFEHTEEGRALKSVYHDTLELWCRLEKVRREGDDYVVFWRRSIQCKIMLLEEFIDEMRGYQIDATIQNSFPNEIYQLAATLGSYTINLGIALNPNKEDELSKLEKALEDKLKLRQ